MAFRVPAASQPAVHNNVKATAKSRTSARICPARGADQGSNSPVTILKQPRASATFIPSGALFIRPASVS